MNQALRRLGAFSNPDKKYSFEELFEQCHIIPRYQQLLYRWLDVLIEQRQLQQKQGQYTNLVPLSADSVNTLVEEVRVRWANTPELVNIVQQCGENLADVLIGEQEPLGLYFAAANNKAGSSNPESPLNTHLKEIMRASLMAVVKSLPPNLNLRILEIGGGQGIATDELLPILPLKQTTYTFTDVGGLFLNQARQKFSDYPFVAYRFLDIEKPPTEQGYSSHSYDVVVAVNVLHVTQNIKTTLEHVRSLLAPGGFLLLWEITQPQLDFDITDGLLMNPLEDEQRSQGNPFLSQQQWQEALHSNGFIEVAAISETETFGEQILVAQVSALATDSAPVAFTATFEQKNVDQNHQVLLNKKPDIADWFYIPSWKRSMPPQPFKSSVNATQPNCWLVFVDECGFGETMVKRLILEGQDVITVSVGEQFNRLSDRLYTINPRQRDDYDALLKELRSLNKTLKKIVHLWNVTPNSYGELAIDYLEKSEALSFWSLLFLTQALGENNQTDSLQIEVISNNMQEVTGSDVLCPEKALVLGPCKVIPQEYSNITCRSIDVVIPSAESRQEEKLIDQLLNELQTQTSDQVIAYRGHHRWVQDFEPVRLNQVGESKQRLTEKGVYLITGGLGGVGLALAEYLAQIVQAKLILIGRSPFPNRSEWEHWLFTHEQQNAVSSKIRKLQTMEALGAEVMVVSADVTNLEQMSAVLKKSKQQFSQINGVIHAAAVSGGGMIQLKAKEAAVSTLAPKVRGIRVLEALFKDDDLDFFVLCSSLSSFLGTSGMVDYTAENAFIDAFAHYNTFKHGTFIRSINWDRWNSVGMAVAVEARHKEITGEELTAGMTCFEAIEAFRRILCNSTVPQVIVSTQDFPTLMKPKESTKSLAEELTQLTRSQPTHPRPKLGNAYVAPRNEVERTIADIWQQLLSIEKVGIYDNFFELGGDSLFATQLIARLCQYFQIELSYKGFFNGSTIAALSEVIVEKLAKQTDQEELAKALADIEQLSEKEVQAILTSSN
ncbi:KR domain-containing protein [Nostoc sp.]|uniref:KR domain-containing protein n=1 Tax=Nostoc sp. TaxID=1180 RepID=UPI003FA5D45F